MVTFVTRGHRVKRLLTWQYISFFFSLTKNWETERELNRPKDRSWDCKEKNFHWKSKEGRKKSWTNEKTKIMHSMKYFRVRVLYNKQFIFFSSFIYLFICVSWLQIYSIRFFSLSRSLFFMFLFRLNENSK